MADTGARPGEAIRLEHRHVHGSRVELPGTKTAGAWRTVHMTSRGVEAVRTPPRAMWIRRVFNIHGRPISGHTSLERSGIPRSGSLVLRNVRRTRCAIHSAIGRFAPAFRSRRWPARWAMPRRSGHSRSTAGGATRWAPTPPRSANHGLVALMWHSTRRKPSRRADIRVPLPALARGAPSGDQHA